MKNIVKIIGFTAGVLIIIWVLSWFFDGAKWVGKGYIADRDARIAGMDAEVPGQIDVLNVGERVFLRNMMGQPFPVTVTAKDDTNITLDANHEMAGKELNFRIELVEVQ